MPTTYANWDITAEKAKAVYVYTRLGKHGLGRCAEWEIMVTNTDDKPIALWVRRVRENGLETGEISLDSTNDRHCIGIAMNEILLWQWGHIFELKFGTPTDINRFISKMRDDAGKYFQITNVPELDDAYWIATSLFRTQKIFGWQGADLGQLHSLYNQVAAHHARQVGSETKSVALFTRKSMGNLRGRSRHGTYNNRWSDT
ncbi:hypothetical protein PFICI_09093 [Pestalotiopsis fici W106-1]|uniref:Uncharacterized protein n=1 Tax=Pestalotiopsis fici (strain W106-1 / CGMCC3.15140) TaxID=1229662 RepID=W3WZI0_PESFW|nr:uncharacterized protein PFICI_09093 [Pestalotiopsis fici W106-1]ETS79240.1 hypothetical protein PFICI_09093 [Pestalotiopsis fici W106-1]